MSSVRKSTVLRCPLCQGWLELAESKPIEPPVIHDPGSPITDNQRRAIFAITKKKGLPEPEHVSGWSKGEASAWINQNG